MGAHFVRTALLVTDEERSWTCRTCATMVEDEGTHCRSCAAYWIDVDAGVFDRLDEADLV